MRRLIVQILLKFLHGNSRMMAKHPTPTSVCPTNRDSGNSASTLYNAEKRGLKFLWCYHLLLSQAEVRKYSQMIWLVKCIPRILFQNKESSTHTYF